MPTPTPVSNTSVLNRLLLTAEDDQAIASLKSFNRAPLAPFAVQAASAVVPNLDADKLDGLHAADIIAAMAGGFAATTVTILNADIKLLPTTPVPLLAAPGAGFQHLVLGISLIAHFQALGYTNVNAGPAFLYAALTSQISEPLVNDPLGAAPDLVDLSTFFAIGAHRCWLGPFRRVREILAYGPCAVPYVMDDNVALTLKVDNNAAGAFTAGDTGNRLIATVYSRVIAV